MITSTKIFVCECHSIIVHNSHKVEKITYTSTQWINFSNMMLSERYWSYTYVHIYTFCSMCKHFISFYYQLISYCMDVNILFIQAAVDGIFNLFHSLAIMDSDAVTFVSKDFCGCMSFISLGNIRE